MLMLSLQATLGHAIHFTEEVCKNKKNKLMTAFQQALDWKSQDNNTIGTNVDVFADEMSE